MSEPRSKDNWEQRVRDTAKGFRYPLTPDISGAVRQRLEGRTAQATGSGRRRLSWALVVVCALAGLLLVPQVRASVRALLRIGVIEIELPTATPQAQFATPLVQQPLTSTPMLTTSTTLALTPTPRPTPVSGLLALVGETTLDAARRRMPYPLRLPTYPADLGPPDRVWVQDLDGPATIVAWMDSENPTRIRLALQVLFSPAFGRKSAVIHLEETQVNGRPAAWVQGRHMLQFERATDHYDYDLGRLVEGNVLIWTDDTYTYRLETDLPLAEAVKIAESLR